MPSTAEMLLYVIEETGNDVSAEIVNQMLKSVLIKYSLPLFSRLCTQKLIVNHRPSRYFRNVYYRYFLKMAGIYIYDPVWKYS